MWVEKMPAWPWQPGSTGRETVRVADGASHERGVPGQRWSSWTPAPSPAWVSITCALFTLFPGLLSPEPNTLHLHCFLPFVFWWSFFNFFDPVFSSEANISTRFEWLCPRLVVSSSTTTNTQDKTKQVVEGWRPGSKLWLVTNKILKFLRKALFPSSLF